MENIWIFCIKKRTRKKAKSDKSVKKSKNQRKQKGEAAPFCAAN